MKNINIIYDDVFNDVDIIAIPDDIYEDIEDIVNCFLNWDAPEDDNDYWVIINGKKYSVLETEGFVKWLNSNYCTGRNKAYIVKQHTNFCSSLISIEF